MTETTAYGVCGGCKQPMHYPDEEIDALRTILAALGKGQALVGGKADAIGNAAAEGLEGCTAREVAKKASAYYRESHTRQQKLWDAIEAAYGDELVRHLLRESYDKRREEARRG